MESHPPRAIAMMWNHNMYTHTCIYIYREREIDRYVDVIRIHRVYIYIYKYLALCACPSRMLKMCENRAKG